MYPRDGSLRPFWAVATGWTFRPHQVLHLSSSTSSGVFLSASPPDLSCLTSVQIRSLVTTFVPFRSLLQVVESAQCVTGKCRVSTHTARREAGSAPNDVSLVWQQQEQNWAQDPQTPVLLQALGCIVCVCLPSQRRICLISTPNTGVFSKYLHAHTNEQKKLSFCLSDGKTSSAVRSGV